MKKILVFSIFSLFSITAFAQVPGRGLRSYDIYDTLKIHGPVWMEQFSNGFVRILSGQMLSCSPLTSADVTPVETDPIFLADSAAMLSPYLRSFLGMKYTDTASMLAPYLRSRLGVKYTDTASMLSPYLRSFLGMKYTDTASMLAPYLRSFLGVKYSDTAAMLANYITTPGLYLLKSSKTLNSDTSTAGLSGYYLRRKDSTVYYPYASNPRGYITGTSITAGTSDFNTVNTSGLVTATYNSAQTAVTRSFNTSYQPSSTTRVYDLDFTVQISIGTSLLTANDGRVSLQTSPDNSTWTEYARCENINGGILGATNGQVTELVAMNVPAGYFYRLSTTQVSGSATFTYIAGHETLRR